MSGPFLAVDIGNSAVKVARWDGTWGEVASYKSSVEAPAHVWAPRLAKLADGARAGGVCSVVPALTPRLADALAEVTGTPPFVVRTDGPLPFRMGYATPHTLGNDRVAAAAAAWLRFGTDPARPLIAFDAGTAITVEAIDLAADGPVYRGGAILPGPHTLRQSLARGTAQLPEVEWERPASTIGTSTREAIQAGLTTLVLDGMAGLLRRTAEALSEPPVIVATGGWGGWLARRLPAVDHVAPHLVLDGVRLLASRPDLAR
ncbi:MAG TPA: type III pantothenate kinase [Bacteroidetes bacterium]|nr:type III pantothenate kinase [Bacteroidota bacterium]